MVTVYCSLRDSQELLIETNIKAVYCSQGVSRCQESFSILILATIQCSVNVSLREGCTNETMCELELKEV